MDNEFRKILLKNKAQKSFYTHTSLITPKGIFSFAYNKLDEFWEKYCNLACNPESIMGLTEMPQQYMPVTADIDIKMELEKVKEFSALNNQKFELGKNIYSEKQLEIVVKTYQKAIKATVKNVTDDDLSCIILEKPSYIKNYNSLEVLSNGFHLHFPKIFLNKNDIQIFILPIVQASLDKMKLFENLSYEESSKVVDKDILTLPWLMYGSRKSAESCPYRVSKVYDANMEKVSLEKAFKNYAFYNQQEEKIVPSRELEFYLPRILSIFPYNREVKNINPIYRAPSFVIPKKSESKEYKDLDISEATSMTAKLLPLISPTRAEGYREWIEMGYVIYNITLGSEEGKVLWKKFSQLSSKYDERACDYYWGMMHIRGYTIGTLKYFAKCDNPVKYKELIYSETRADIKVNLKTGSHYDIAQAIHKLFSSEFICASISKQVWYQFRDHHWEDIDSGVFLRNKISDDILKIVDHLKKEEVTKKNDTDDDVKKSMHEKRISYIEKLQEKLKNSPYKDNIMKESRYLFHDRHFISKLDSNPNIIAFKNGVYDLIKNEFRDGKPDDYVSKKLPVNYNKDLSLTDRRVEKVLDFFRCIFPDEKLRNYFLDNLSEIFDGGNKKKRIFMWTGSGDNGKSVTQKLIDSMLGCLAVKIPTTLITGKKPNIGSAFPEIARLSGVRSATMEEPNADERINIGILKNLTGNDTLLGRDLYEKGKDTREITPMFKLNFICNDLPLFNTSDKATWNRVRVILFEARFVDHNEAPETEKEQMKQKIFPKDEDFDRKIPSMTEALAWYLLYHRINFRKPNTPEPDKVKLATKEYQNNNDFVAQFISESFVVQEGGMITLDEIYPLYRLWHRENISGTAPTKKHLKESIIKSWGDPINPGCRWLGYRQYTLTDQIADGEVVILPEKK